MAVVGMFDHLDRVAAHRRGTRQDGPRAWSTEWMVDHTGASRRQLQYWVECGLFGLGHRSGSGSRRRWTASEFEIVTALATLAALGARQDHLAVAARAVRAARVHAAGEKLVVPLEGPAFRHPASSPLSSPGPAWLLPLVPCPFSPAGGPLDSTASPQAGDHSHGGDA